MYMYMEEIDIVSLIENNPVTKLSKDYNVNLLSKIKKQFTDFDQERKSKQVELFCVNKA